MEEYSKFYSNDMMAMMRVPVNPDMMAWIDNENKKGWIVVRDTPENIITFNDKFKHMEIPDGVKIFYNEPYFYDLIEDGVHTRARIKEEKERQEMLKNPQIDLDINNKEEFIEYLIGEVIGNEQSIIWEYSRDTELDEVKLKAKEKELRRLADKLL